jgi:TPR repeat protein
MIEDGTSPEATGMARELYGNACIRKDPRGCYELGRMLRDGIGGAVDLDKAWFSFYQSCEEMGLPDACGPLEELRLQLGIE